MLILINDECLLDPYDITEAVQYIIPNPKYVPDLQTSTLGTIEGNKLPMNLEFVKITYKNGKTRELEMPFKEFCEQITAKTKQ